MTRQWQTNSTSRRTYLKAVGSASGIGLLGGCMGGDGDGEDQPTDPDSEETTTGDGTTAGNETTSGDTETTLAVNDEMETVSFATLGVGASGVATTIMKEEGIDKKHNLNVNVRDMGLTEAENAVFRGTVDTGIFAPIAAARANVEGQNIRIFAPHLNNHNSVLVKPDSPYESLDDLVGKSFGSFERITGSYNAFFILANAMGYNLEEDFNLTLGEAIPLLNLFDRGDLEATLAFESFVTRWIAREDARELFRVNKMFNQELGHNNLFIGLGTHEQWLNDNQSKAIKLQRAYLETQSTISENPDFIESYAEPFGLENQKEIDLGMERIPRIYPTEWSEELISGGQVDIQAARESGLIPQDAPDDVFWQSSG